MSRAKAAGINTTLIGAAFSAFLGFGWLVNLIDPQPTTDLAVWAYMWAGVSSLSLGIAILTFIIEITDHLAHLMTGSPRGRHAR